MGSHMNYKNFAEMPVVEGSGGKAQGNYPLARQPSIYSLTFDELQNTLGGHGKDFGSMNMDELLKNIWSAEETQTMTISAGGRDGSDPGGNLQRQGSLTLPRTLSQKTVDEVWRDLIKETEGVKDGSGGIGGLNLPQRQQTLGEMTLEEFLVRAGVVREDTQPFGRPNNSGLYGELLHPSNNGSLVFGFQQSNQNNGFLGNRIMESNSSVPCQLPSLALNVGGIGSSQQQPQLQQHQHQHQPPQLPPILPKQAPLAFASPMNLINSAHLANSGAKGAIGITDQSMNKNLVRGGGTGMVGLRNGGVAVATGSPTNQPSPDVIAKSNVDTSSLSPVPYAFNRGRKGNGPLEKVVERRQRRMIKNRESAARSRARKQAYTLELEAEVAKLKEMNEELQRKQAEVMKMQKNQILETMNRQWGGKRQCLRRTLTGPW